MGVYDGFYDNCSTFLPYEAIFLAGGVSQLRNHSMSLGIQFFVLDLDHKIAHRVIEVCIFS